MKRNTIFLLWVYCLLCLFETGYSQSVKIISERAVAVETGTLKATIEQGLLTSLVRKSDGRQFVSADAGSLPAIQLIYSGGETITLGQETGDRYRLLQINDRQAHLIVESWYGDAVLVISADPETDDLIVEPSAYASRPGLISCRWVIGGLAEGLELVAPLFQGVQVAVADPLINNTHWRWPRDWEAGLAIFQGDDGGFWLHCRNYNFKFVALQVGTADYPSSVGFDTEAYGPADNSLGSGGIAWRINVFEGGWQVPAAKYRNWMAETYKLNNNIMPAWVKNLRLAVSWCPTEPEVLDKLKNWVDPSQVILHLPHWRTDPYDENYPHFEASSEAREFIAKARGMGYHVMPHFNAIDMDPSNPAYPFVRDFQYRELESKKVAGWSWVDRGIRPVPESNAARLRNRRNKTMIKVHPGLAMWRSILAENIMPSVDKLDLEVVFIDVSHHPRNLHNAFVENMTSAEGMIRLEKQIGEIGKGLVVGGEGRNEITIQGHQITQVHLYRSSGPSIEGLNRLKPCPLSEFLFGKWCRSFGYSRLSGKSESEAQRMQMHLDWGAIPTITLESNKELDNPNQVLKNFLDALKN